LGGFDSLFSTLDSDPNHRGYQFEHVCRWYLLNDPIYRRQLRQVWLWDDWPGRWGADAGIDLVAETQDGRLWAIQAKAYNPSYSVKKADVDSFLSESGRKEFSYRLLIATTDRIAATATRAMRGQEKMAGQLMLSDLRRSEVGWPVSIDDLRSEPAQPKTPLPHQGEAIEAVLKGFRESDRGQLIMACGTGKTLASLWITETLETQRTLVLVPSLSLLRQTLREWLVNTNREFSYLPVCSDDTVRDKDSMVGHVSDLGFPATSDAEEIASFLKEPGPSVVFSTYQSSPVVALAMCDFDGEFDLVLADEAHRCAGPVSSDFGTVLDADLIRARRRLFMTATPRLFTGRIRREAKEADFEIASMDDDEKFGAVFHRLSFGEAIERKLLSDYRVVVVGVDDTLYRQYAESGRFVTRDGVEVTDARSLAAQIGLAKAQRDYDLRRTISFHGRVKSAKEFADSFPDVIQWIPDEDRPAGRIWTDHVSGKMNSFQRESRLDRMRHQTPDERSVLSNARCLSEGVDVPALDGVAFIDPKKSEVDIVQAVGRAIRRSKDKTLGTIVIPVFVDPNENPDVALRDSRYKPIWDVIMALRGHDEQLGVELDELRRGLAKSKELHIPARITLDLPERVGRAFVQAFKTVLIEQTTSSWERFYGYLLEYVNREGHSRVPKKYSEREVKIGIWVSTQRHRKQIGKLSARRIELLASLPDWSWDTLDERWEEGFRLLKQFVKREGHTRVRRYHVEDDFKLGLWVTNQKTKKRNGELESERMARFSAIPEWTWAFFADAWEKGFGALLRFIRGEGHGEIPTGYVDDEGFRLFSWANQQRSRERSETRTLAPDRWARLDALPEWSWHPDEDRWDKKYQALFRYAEREGHIGVKQRHREDGLDLLSFIRQQQSALRDNKLSERRERLLRALPYDILIDSP
jgi:predicted helicase